MTNTGWGPRTGGHITSKLIQEVFANINLLRDYHINTVTLYALLKQTKSCPYSKEYVYCIILQQFYAFYGGSTLRSDFGIFKENSLICHVEFVKMRSILHIRASWLLMICFSCLICLNFYVNVWMVAGNDDFVLELTPNHMSHPGSKFMWAKNRHSKPTPVNGINISATATPRNYLEAPVSQAHWEELVENLKRTSPLPKHRGVWPNRYSYDDDRIIQQLKYNPTSGSDAKSVPAKTILLYNGFKDWNVKEGRQTFLDQNCPVNNCLLTGNRRSGSNADAILFHQYPKFPWFRRPPEQIWILYLLEAPYFTPSLRKFNGQFNWTATYRHDSDIVAPYQKFVKDNSVPKIHTKMTKNYSAGKTKKIAWFVSNCRASNTRLEYAKELSQYMQVDIFGKCGDKQCHRKTSDCSDMLNKDYKFYLSFENSNCRDYITEKYFVNGLQ